MTVQRTHRCDGPDCDGWIQGPVTHGWLQVAQHDVDRSATWHFCSWDCLLLAAAKREPSEALDA